MINPTSSEIDKINLAGYSRIARHYSDGKRLTTSNFHFLGRRFFFKNIKKYSKSHSSVLDLGCGQGYLHKLLHSCLCHTALPKEYIAIDLSIEMLNEIPCTAITKKICASAFALPLEDSTVDVAFSSLIASFLTKEAIQEIARVLKPRGSLIFSTPSKTWSDAIRDTKKSNMTRFKTNDGDDVWVYSLTYTDLELSDMLEVCGFEIVNFQILTGEILLEENQDVSPSITKAAFCLGINLKELPILQLVEAKKK